MPGIQESPVLASAAYTLKHSKAQINMSHSSVCFQKEIAILSILIQLISTGLYVIPQILRPFELGIDSSKCLPWLIWKKGEERSDTKLGKDLPLVQVCLCCWFRALKGMVKAMNRDPVNP